MATFTREPAPASEPVIEATCDSLGVRTDAWIANFWRKADGALLDDRIVIYSTGSILERNVTFDIAQNHPGSVAVGDDSGSRSILMPQNGNARFYLVDHGSIDAEHAEAFSTLEALVKFVVAEPVEDTSSQGTVVTRAGAKPRAAELLQLSKMPGVGLSMVQLKALFGPQERALLRRVYFERYREYIENFSALIRFSRRE